MRGDLKERVKTDSTPYCGEIIFNDLKLDDDCISEGGDICTYDENC